MQRPIERIPSSFAPMVRLSAAPREAGPMTRFFPPNSTRAMSSSCLRRLSALRRSGRACYKPHNLPPRLRLLPALRQVGSRRVISIMMTFTFQAAGFNPLQDVVQSRAASTASAYAPLNFCWYQGLALLALYPESRLRVEEQTKWQHFPLLPTALQRNAAFTVQPSYRSLARTR